VRLTELAFRTLGRAADLHEIEAVARDLREHGTPEDLALFEPIGGDEYAPMSGALCDLAERCGSSGFVCLDLLCEVRSPGGQRRVLERGRPMKGDDETRVSDVRDT
jgi:hypothetical protein